MSTTQRIAKNTSVLLVSQIITYVFGFFITIYAANYLGANGFGILSLALSITAIFGIISDMGLSTLMVREVARNKSLMNRYVSNTILMRIILSFLACGMIILKKELYQTSCMVNPHN
ncbi:putative membrane protein [Methanobacterium sp. MB1]|jgi:O-antigen/teichoic acid export membrane protein|uniref:oligosaccharide flippase family protein n=1 Tax=Methanobacterium sp. TaxID=2164 RepID=UPI0003C9295E|nr:oligosaccharide flippase family protein [uncultured Methanobacterium sp.]CDG65196.1 putative membrane protein [Methanobacterium sp. MB1]